MAWNSRSQCACGASEDARDDGGDDANRLLQRVAEHHAVQRDGAADDLVGPARKVAEVRDGQRDVGRPRHRQRLAIVLLKSKLRLGCAQPDFGCSIINVTHQCAHV